MKQYTGTKTVKAVPMTYGEAHERGLIRENAYVEEYNDNKGYHVIYPDGYESWSPAEVFEDAYKLSVQNQRQFIFQNWGQNMKIMCFQSVRMIGVNIIRRY